MYKSKSTLPETHIFIGDRSADGSPGHVARSVYVNGVEVVVAEDGIDIDYGPRDLTKVTLVLYPKTVTFGPAPEPSPLESVLDAYGKTVPEVARNA